MVHNGKVTSSSSPRRWSATGFGEFAPTRARSAATAAKGSGNGEAQGGAGVRAERQPHRAWQRCFEDTARWHTRQNTDSADQRASAAAGRLIRGKGADEALDLLRYQPNQSARMLERFSASALANAEDRWAPNVEWIGGRRCPASTAVRCLNACAQSPRDGLIFKKRMPHISVALEERKMGQKVNPTGFALE